MTALMFSMIKKQIDDWMAEFGQDNMPPPFQIYTFQSEPGPGNVHFVQKIFQGEFEFDVLFNSGAASQEMTSEDLTEGLSNINEGFDKRFDSTASQEHGAWAHKLEAVLACQLNLTPPRNSQLDLRAVGDESR